MQIANAIEHALKSGDVHVGQRLPAERRLATQLGVSRTTATYAFVQALHEHAASLRFRVPSGGYYVWAQLPTGLAAAEVVAAAQETGVVVRAGRLFSPEDRETGHLRLCFAAPAIRQISEGVRRLDASVDKVRRHMKDAPSTAERVPMV